ncbi:hypothetical protein PYW08_003090 [Mythimna loreyi]|uniref:Uncharacterized protein n=1 Tax=Mythimna loreyi TaxID=667449 RepID=A0ACC2QVA5_9NEOP|nr:hypothetical protein PYW08_003090 [Mythimna loreyi]
MNKTQAAKRFRSPQITRHNDSLNRFKQGVRAKVSTGIEVLHPPLRGLRKSRSKQKTVASRCCYVSPENKNFGQYFSRNESPKKSKDAGVGPPLPADDIQLLTFLQVHNLELGKSVTTNPKEPKKVSHSCRSSRNKMKSSPERSSPGRSSYSPVKSTQFDESDWLILDRPEDVDMIIGSKGLNALKTPKYRKTAAGKLFQPFDVRRMNEDIGTETSSTPMEKGMGRIPPRRTSTDASTLERPSNPKFISDVPRVKVIAERFSKYKKGNLELRRLDEKVVCVEYDVYNESSHHEGLKPVQRLRAFFSIKPSGDKDSKDQGLPKLPPNIKNEFDVVEEDLEKLTEKEIEFIDTDIEENQSYLDDLRRILKRKEVISAHRNRTSLDLHCLYEMAKRDGRPLKTDYSAMNLLTEEELKEVKQLILERCTSSVHGFRRRTIKKQGSPLNQSVISDNLMTEMLRCET